MCLPRADICILVQYVSGYYVSSACDKHSQRSLFTLSFVSQKIRLSKKNWTVFARMNISLLFFCNMWMLHSLSQTLSLIINAKSQSCEVDYKIQKKKEKYDHHYSCTPSFNVFITPYSVICGDKRTWNMQTQNYPDWKTNELKLPLRVVSTILFIHKSKLSGELLGPESQMDSFWSAKDAETSDGYFFIYLFGIFGYRLLYVFSSSLASFVIIRAKNIEIRVGASWKRYCCLTKLNYCYAISMPFCHVTMFLLFV